MSQATCTVSHFRVVSSLIVFSDVQRCHCPRGAGDMAPTVWLLIDLLSPWRVR
jgi:hypothetical protein